MYFILIINSHITKFVIFLFNSLSPSSQLSIHLQTFSRNLVTRLSISQERGKNHKL